MQNLETRPQIHLKGRESRYSFIKVLDDMKFQNTLSFTYLHSRMQNNKTWVVFTFAYATNIFVEFTASFQYSAYINHAKMCVTLYSTESE